MQVGRSKEKIHCGHSEERNGLNLELYKILKEYSN